MHFPTRVCIARHGETDWNVAGILQGWLDVPINDKGRSQARQLADAIAHAGFSRIYTSPLGRALETAEIIAARLGLPTPLCHEGLKERHFGVIQGIPKTELAELNPVLYQQLMKRNPACDFEQGEPLDDFAGRVLKAVMDIAARHPGDCVLAVTHGWVMDVITRLARGLPHRAILPIKSRNMECLWLEATGQFVRAGTRAQ